jgi:hypothetical protein
MPKELIVLASSRACIAFCGLTPELTRRERAAFKQTGEDKHEKNAIKRSG